MDFGTNVRSQALVLTTTITKQKKFADLLQHLGTNWLIHLIAYQRHYFGVNGLYRQISQLYVELIQAYFCVLSCGGPKYMNNIPASVYPVSCKRFLQQLENNYRDFDVRLKGPYLPLKQRC